MLQVALILLVLVVSADGSAAPSILEAADPEAPTQRRLLGSGSGPACSFDTMATGTDKRDQTACADIADTECKALCQFYYSASVWGCFSRDPPELVPMQIAHRTLTIRTVHMPERVHV